MINTIPAKIPKTIDIRIKKKIIKIKKKDLFFILLFSLLEKATIGRVLPHHINNSS